MQYARCAGGTCMGKQGPPPPPQSRPGKAREITEKPQCFPNFQAILFPMNAQGKASCAMPNGGGMGARGKQALGGTIRQPTGGRAVFQGWGKRAVFSIGEPVAGTPGGGFDNGRRGVVGKGGEGKGGRSPPARIAIVNTAWGGFAEAATGAAVRPQGGGEGP